ncbi:DUF5679 domain-containing protein [Chloroflexota bacterium]
MQHFDGHHLSRAKREMKNTQSVIMKNGRPATQDVCTPCGTNKIKGRSPS